MMPFVSYFNDAYVALVRGDEPYFCEKFGNMRKLMDHSYICLLNLTFVLAIDLKTSIDRAALNTSTLETYAQCLIQQLAKQKSTYQKTFTKKLSHQCNGEQDITRCDPTKPMFNVTEVVD
jgi:hypothetical protein